MSKPACLTWTVDGSGLDDWHRDECAMCGGSATIAGRMVMDHDHACLRRRIRRCGRRDRRSRGALDTSDTPTS